MNKKNLLKTLVILSCSLITLLIMGYHFGTFDQVVHIPTLRKLAYPDLYPKDPYFLLMKDHPSFFWFLFIPFLKSNTLEITLFVVYIFSLILTYLAIWELSNTLFNSFKLNILSTIVWVIPHIGFAGFPVFEFSLINRTFLLPFTLFSIILYLKRRYILSFLLLGLIINLHALSSIYVLILLTTDILLSKTYKNKSIFIGTILFLIISSPILFWAYQSININSITNITEWFYIISKPIMDNIFYPLNINPPYILLTLNGLLPITFFLLSKNRLIDNKYYFPIKNFLIGTIFSISLFIVSSYLIHISIILKLQLIRIGIFSLILIYPYLIKLILDKYNNNGNLKEFILSYIVIFISISPITVIAYPLFSKNRLTKILFFIILSFLTTFLLYFSYSNKIWKPGIFIYAQNTPYYDVQNWAKKNTPNNSLFLAPTYDWSVYDYGWKVFSERSSLIHLSDSLEIAFSTEYTTIWRERFENTHPGILSKFNYNFFSNREILKQDYNSISLERLKKIVNKYKIDYFVTESSIKYPLKVKYKNKQYTVYDLDML